MVKDDNHNCYLMCDKCDGEIDNKSFEEKLSEEFNKLINNELYVFDEEVLNVYGIEQLKMLVMPLLKLQREEIKKEVENKLFKEVKGGWKQKGEIGMATNGAFVEAYNIALEEVIKILE